MCDVDLSKCEKISSLKKHIDELNTKLNLDTEIKLNKIINLIKNVNVEYYKHNKRRDSEVPIKIKLDDDKLKLFKEFGKGAPTHTKKEKKKTLCEYINKNFYLKLDYNIVNIRNIDNDKYKHIKTYNLPKIKQSIDTSTCQNIYNNVNNNKKNYGELYVIQEDITNEEWGKYSKGDCYILYNSDNVKFITSMNTEYSLKKKKKNFLYKKRESILSR